jgi:prophage regulatory protein
VTEKTTPKYLRLRQVEEMTGLGHTTIYRLIDEKKFPAQRQITERAVGWLSHQVIEWMNSRPAVTPRKKKSAPVQTTA